MGLRSVVTDHLADLEMAHGSDKDLPEDQYNQKSGNRSADGAKGYIAEDIQAADTGM
jgi:hypothetical protein